MLSMVANENSSAAANQQGGTGATVEQLKGGVGGGKATGEEKAGQSAEQKPSLREPQGS